MIQPHMSQSIMRPSYDNQVQQIQRSSDLFYSEFSCNEIDSTCPVTDYISDYQNFLRDAPLLAINLKPD